MVAGLVLAGGCTSVSSGDDRLFENEGVGTTVGDPAAGVAEPGGVADEPTTDPDTGDVAERPQVAAPSEAGALITPTGVVVPVTDFTALGYEVMTPCGVPGLVSWGTPLTEIEIVLDPGHGGDIETGAVGPNGLVERDINLTLAKRTANELAERGISVVLTRTGDYRVPLSVRAEIANQLGARAIISIHHNAPQGSPSAVPGTEIFVQKDSEESRRLGGTLYEAIVDALDDFDIEWQAAPDAGVLEVLNDDGEDTYGMVRRPEMPGVLVELGYLANPAEAEFFATDDYADVASVALADGIEAWLITDAEGDGFVDEPRNFTPNGLTGGSSGCVDPALE